MRLSLRILALFMLGVIGLLAVDGAFLVRREMQVLDRELEDNALHLGRTYGRLLAHVARLDGPDQAVALSADLDGRADGMRVRWIRLDAPAGDPEAPRLDAAGLAALRDGVEVSRRGRAADGSAARITCVPVDLGAGRSGALELTASYAPLDHYRRLIVRRAVAFGGLAVLMGVVMSWLILRPLVGRPLARMLEKTEEIGAGDFTCNLDIPGRGELSDLSVAMNRMCCQLDEARTSILAETKARIAALEQLRHTERLAVLGRISSGLAHELGTPLNVVSGRADMISSGLLDAQEIDESAAVITGQCDRMTGIIRQFLDYARRPGGTRRPEDVTALVRGALTLMEPTARTAGVALRLEAADDVPGVPLDRNQLQQVLTNLIVNAIHAMPDGGEVAVAVARAPEGGAVRLRIADQGVGIPADKLDQIFEPFFTTKETGRGTGLGLSIVKGIIEEHGGTITVASTPGEGTTFTIDLPVPDPA